MKDYKRVAKRIGEMGTFCEIFNCGCPTENFPVNLYFKLSEPYVIGFEFYVSYSFGEWSIDFTLDNSIHIRTDMQRIRCIKTDREMYSKVEEIIGKIRNLCRTSA